MRYPEGATDRAPSPRPPCTSVGTLGYFFPGGHLGLTRLYPLPARLHPLPALVRARSAACVLCCSCVRAALLPRAPGARTATKDGGKNPPPFPLCPRAACSQLMPHARIPPAIDHSAMPSCAASGDRAPARLSLKFRKLEATRLPFRSLPACGPRAAHVPSIHTSRAICLRPACLQPACSAPALPV